MSDLQKLDGLRWQPDPRRDRVAHRLQLHEQTLRHSDADDWTRREALEGRVEAQGDLEAGIENGYKLVQIGTVPLRTVGWLPEDEYEEVLEGQALFPVHVGEIDGDRLWIFRNQFFRAEPALRGEIDICEASGLQWRPRPLTMTRLGFVQQTVGSSRQRSKPKVRFRSNV